MKVLVGLGNPGRAYATARHNVGFQVLTAISEAEGLTFRPGSGAYEEAKERDGHYLLVKPTTFVNASGVAVRQLRERRPFELNDLLVVYDDMDLPLGALRLRPKGGAGGHKGLESIIYQLGSEAFPRLRLGINSPARGSDDVAFVLSPFAEAEWEQAQTMIARAAEAALSFVTDGLTATMNRYNIVSEEVTAPESA